jgi:hypothetical protein
MNILKTFFRGFVVALIIAMPTETTLSIQTLTALLPIIIGYITTHYVMLIPYLKQQLSEHWKFNWTDAMSTVLFTVISGVSGYFIDTLHDHEMVTWSAFGFAMWRAIVYAGKCYAKNSADEIKIENSITNNEGEVLK